MSDSTILKRLTNYLVSLREGDALYVFLSGIYAKLISFLISVIAIRLIPKEEFGWISFAMTIIVFLSPFAGAGLDQSLMRYGGLSNSQLAKKDLLRYCLSRGSALSLALILLVLLLSKLLTRQLHEAWPFLILLVFMLFGLFLQSMTLVYLRVIRRNKAFASARIFFSTLSLILVIVLCYFYSSWGYAIALVAGPIIGFIFLSWRLRFFSGHLKVFEIKTDREFHVYGAFTSIGTTLAQLIFTVDIFLIGYLLSDGNQVAQYRATNIIPYSALVFPMTVMITDFVKIVRMTKTEPKDLMRYYLSYLGLFVPLSVIFLAVVHFFGSDLMKIFGQSYHSDSHLMFVFAIGICGAFLLRVPLGHFVSAVGWSRLNVIIASFMLILNAILTFYFVQKNGILGAAISSSIVLWGNGIIYLGAMGYWYIRAKADHCIEP